MNHSMSETCYLFEASFISLKFDYSAFHLVCLCSAVWTSVVVLKISLGCDFLKDLSQSQTKRILDLFRDLSGPHLRGYH